MRVQAPKRLFSVRDFYQMAEAGIFDEDDRVELLAGEIVEMTPIGSRHAGCVNRLHHMFHEQLGSAVIISVQNPVRLDNHTEPQPDVTIARFREDFYRDAHPGPSDVLLIVEVPDTSVDVDRQVKVPLYARAGVPEVWLIDLEANVVDVFARPVAGEYRDKRHVRPGDSLAIPAVPGQSLTVADILA